MNSPKIAISQDFVLGLGRLPLAVQGRVNKWMMKFQQDPTSPGINYETIKAARDPNLRSVRIDQDWRGIVFKPDKGDVYILLHVDKHDDAYRWAERRKLAVNPITGALQVLCLETVNSAETAAPSVSSSPALTSEEAPSLAPLFKDISDEELIQLGTPQEMIAVVRGIRAESDLDALQAVLPLEAYEGLFLVAAGDRVSQILADRETRVDQKIDVSDYEKALAAPESQSRFVVVTNDAELMAILNAPLAQWRTFLHPIQRKLAAGDRSGPVRILGGAGTGKTVLAIHRAAWLARNRCTEEASILFTTFTRNLALDIEQNLKSLMLDDPALKRIEVMNLDRWVHRFLRQKRYEHRIIYQRDETSWGRALETADSSLGLYASFYEEEWDQIIAPQGVRTLDDYRKVTRVGRKAVLTRSKRDAIWPVFEEYRAQLSSRQLKDVDDAYGDAANLLASGSSRRPYEAIIVDETQDFGAPALRLLRAMAEPGKNDLFFVGDGHQRIYPKHRAVLGRCGIDIRGRSKKLYLNYRTTDEIRRAAVALLEGRDIDDLDGGKDDNKRYKSLSHGAPPEMVEVANAFEAADRAIKRAQDWHAAGGDVPPSICVIVPSNRVRDDIARRLSTSGTPAQVIDADSFDRPESRDVRVATMHRAKGLEFDRVIVMTSGGTAEDDNAALVYVAITRAKAAAMLIRY
ncbi:MAG: putative ATP-dependent DNA helicase YjcD [Firmicutes bacterium]|nr:putative ATP-dependent DNA helicase YjcD [Bacillota bacterium]